MWPENPEQAPASQYQRWKSCCDDAMMTYDKKLKISYLSTCQLKSGTSAEWIILTEISKGMLWTLLAANPISYFRSNVAVARYSKSWFQVVLRVLPQQKFAENQIGQYMRLCVIFMMLSPCGQRPMLIQQMFFVLLAFTFDLKFVIQLFTLALLAS